MTVAVVLLTLVAVPFGMVADGCTRMGTMCESACSAQGTSIAPLAGGSPLAVVGTPLAAAVPQIPTAPLNTIDVPPKSLLPA